MVYSHLKTVWTLNSSFLFPGFVNLGRTEKSVLGGEGDEISTLGLDISRIQERTMRPDLQKVLREVE